MSVKELFWFDDGREDEERVRVEWVMGWPGIPEKVRRRIDLKWEEAMGESRRRGKMLFNAPMSLYRGHRVEEGRLILTLGPGDYRLFFVTALRDHAWFAAHAPEHVYAAMGNSAILTTPDGVIMGRRSERVASYAGRLHVFGGVMDLPEIQDRSPTAKNLVDHVRRELSEELGVQDFANGPVPVGLYCDAFLHQPEMIWRCHAETFDMRVEREEHDAVEIVPWYETVGDSLRATYRQEMTPVAFEAWKKIIMD